MSFDLVKNASVDLLTRSLTLKSDIKQINLFNGLKLRFFLVQVMGEFIKVMMTMWKSELDKKPEGARRSVKGKMEIGTYEQTRLAFFENISDNFLSPYIDSLVTFFSISLTSDFNYSEYSINGRSLTEYYAFNGLVEIR